jgi:hypothetical protein
MVRPLFAASVFAVAAFAASAATAGCTKGCSTCCNLPTGHNITVPGINVTPPSINVGPPSIGCPTCGGGDPGGGFGSINVTVNVNQTAIANANAGAGASAGLSNAAAANLIIGGGGGGGGWVDSGPSTSIGALNVVVNEAPPPPPPRPVCVAHKTVFAMVAVQAMCLDDRGSPHPASQTRPERDVADGFSGELFRCVAGARMQYVTSDYQGGTANFDRGQTKVCAKGDALWRNPDGQIQCRPQTAARDCNERSLLRRYGPGIKVMKMAGAEVCAAWSTDQVVAAAPPVPPQYAAQSFVGDGGVGRGGW